ncbi:MAG: hypothetical protein ACK5B9_08370 [Flavobacteriia bacterium]|jgi:hypothetical protein
MSFTSKLILILTFGFIFSNGVKAQIYFPEELLVDPLSYQLKDLKISKIEQYSISKYKNDTVKRYFLNFVVKYDSNHVVTEFLDQFLKMFKHEIFNKNKELKLRLKKDFTQYYFHSNSGQDSAFYTFRITNYKYKNGDVEKIIIQEPVKYILDGVYTAEYKKGDNFEVVQKYEDRLIKKEEHYKDGKCISDKEYFYKIIIKNNREFCLLDKVIEYNDFGQIETHLKYYF